MGRISEGPWFRQGKNTWYATVRGKTVSLGVRGERGLPEAWAEYLRRTGESPPPPPTQTVARLVDAFLAAKAGHLKPNTVRIYGSDLRSLVRWQGLGDKGPNEVRPSDIQAWAAALKVSDTTRAMSIRSVGAFFGWLVRDGVLEANPVRRVVKPRSRKRGREAVMSDATFAALLAAASPQFASVLRFLRATGCRPGEVSQVTAAAFDEATRTVLVASHKTDRDGHARTLFLDTETAEMVASLARRFPSGPVFRTYKGTVWTGRAITQAVRGTRERAGVLGRAYDLRHTYVTEALAAGVSDSEVAALVGHSSPATIHASYSHVTAKGRQLGQTAEDLRKRRAG